MTLDAAPATPGPEADANAQAAEPEVADVRAMLVILAGVFLVALILLALADPVAHALGFGDPYSCGGP